MWKAGCASREILTFQETKANMLRTLLLLLISTSGLLAQPLPTIAEKTKGMQRMEGLFPLYWDASQGRLWMEAPASDAEFLYVTSLPAGLGSNDIGLDRGLLGGGRIVKLSRVGRKLLLVQPNFDYRALSADPNERRAVEQSFAQSVLWGFGVEAETEGRCLVELTDFLTRDAMQAANRIRKAQQGSYAPDKTRSAIHMPATRNFPFNTEMEAVVTLVNSDGTTGPFVNAVTPSPEAITLRMHHSFVRLPEPGFRPRTLDARSGFNDVSYFDYATPVSEPIEKRLAVRHRLQKKDPSQPIGDPVKPIVYWLDNGTPEPIRTALLNGARWWNQAFEAAGYRNAFQVRVLPDSSDPMDIRYNMINWVHRSTRGWSYGASVVDPRTGEIIKGQVSLGSLRVRQDYLIAQGLLSPFEKGLPADDPMMRMALERLEQLAAHEVGHTLGLMHNYASSVNDRASVMDYPHPLVRLGPDGHIDLAGAYGKGIGEWDRMAIRWGYADFQAGTVESDTLDAILQQGIRKGMLFISDRDARAAGGAHPSAHLWDNGKDAVGELAEVMKVRRKALESFGWNSIRPGMPAAMLEDVLVPVYLYHRYQLEAVTKLVGGADYAYALRGDGQPAVRIIPRREQVRALEAVLATMTPGELVVPDRIADLIPPRPANYEYTRELFRRRAGLGFDALTPAESAADMPLSFLFHPERLSRMAQQEPRGGLGVSDMCSRIIDATWKAPRQTGTLKLVQQQTEQIVLTYLLAASVDDQLSFAARAAVAHALSGLKAYIAKAAPTAADPSYAAHLSLALERMKSPEKAKATQHTAPPPGAPIGCW
jgi:hypothetical protein